MVEENLPADSLTIRVSDDGCGMAPEVVARVTDPFYTSRTCRKVGLGLPLLAAAAQRCDGSFTATSELGTGTTVVASFRHSHVDRPPLGDLHSTLLSALVGHPDVDFVYRHRVGDRVFELDGAAIKRELEGVPLSHPSVLRWLDHFLTEGLVELGVLRAPVSTEERIDAKTEQP